MTVLHKRPIFFKKEMQRISNEGDFNLDTFEVSGSDWEEGLYIKASDLFIIKPSSKQESVVQIFSTPNNIELAKPHYNLDYRKTNGTKLNLIK